MPSNPDDVILVKLPRALHQRLRELGELWQVAHSRGKLAPGGPDHKALSLQKIITILLDRDEAHRQRARTKKRARQYQG